MLVNDKDALNRLNSPMNLINKLREKTSVRSSAMSLFIPKKNEKQTEEVTVTFNPFTTKVESQTQLLPQSDSKTESLDNILEDHEAQIKLGLAHDKALELLNRSVQMLTDKLDDVSSAKLPSVIAAASKTVESIRKERIEQTKNGKDREVHYHFYTPTQKPISDYKIIEVSQ